MQLTVARQDVGFRSGDAECRGWLYMPERVDSEPVACVVLAHGFAGVKEARLDAFAERFAAAGYAALVFDYRHFGDSDGEPRQLLEIGLQHADWRAAIGYARGLEDIDANRIVLWGTSYSGGHVIAVAAADQRIAAVISQAPHTDGVATLRAAGAADLLRLTVAGLRDQARAMLGRDPYLIPVVGPPGTLAAINSPDAEPGYRALFPPGYEWSNRFTARAALWLGAYAPIRKASKVQAPLLVQLLTEDAVTPPEAARKTARRAPRGELIEYPGGHFDIYVGEPFERAIADQLAFLERALAA